LSALGSTVFTHPWKRQDVSTLMFTTWMDFLLQRYILNWEIATYDFENAHKRFLTVYFLELFLFLAKAGGHIFLSMAT